MAQQEGQEIYDVYLTVFSKVRSAVQMASTDFRDPTTPMHTPAYKGKQLVAAALGVLDGKYTNADLRTKSNLEAEVEKYMK